MFNDRCADYQRDLREGIDGQLSISRLANGIEYLINVPIFNACVLRLDTCVLRQRHEQPTTTFH